MATPEDLQANADYIRMADQYVEVRGHAVQPVTLEPCPLTEIVGPGRHE